MGTSLRLSILRLPIWTFPDFLHFFVPSCPRTFKYRHKVRFQLPLLLSQISQQREATANPVFASVAGKRPPSETSEVVYKKKEKSCQSHSIMRVGRRRRSKMLRTVASPGTFGCQDRRFFYRCTVVTDKKSDTPCGLWFTLPPSRLPRFCASEGGKRVTSRHWQGVACTKRPLLWGKLGAQITP